MTAPTARRTRARPAVRRAARAAAAAPLPAALGGPPATATITTTMPANGFPFTTATAPLRTTSPTAAMPGAAATRPGAARGHGRRRVRMAHRATAAAMAAAP